jgi:hypothetical protein
MNKKLHPNSVKMDFEVHRPFTADQAQLLVKLYEAVKEFNQSASGNKDSGYGDSPDLSDLKTITPDVARHLAKLPALDLQGLTTLDPASAAFLSRVRLDLNLSGLRSISGEAAAELAKAKCTLVLDGVQSMPLNVAKVLAKHGGKHTILSLNGIKKLSPEVAKVLVSHRGCLFLNSVSISTHALAEAFSSKYRRCCCLNVGNFDFNDLEAARSLVDGGGVLTAEVAKITPELTEIFLKGKTDASLVVGTSLRRKRYNFSSEKLKID